MIDIREREIIEFLEMTRVAFAVNNNQRVDEIKTDRTLLDNPITAV